MFGMEIRLNEQYIAKKGQYKIEDLIATIDRLFNHYGFRKKVEDRSLYYLGNNIILMASTITNILNIALIVVGILLILLAIAILLRLH